VSLTERLFVPLRHAAPASPLITYYDDADGSRVELSAATAANWAAKTANWLTEELDVAPGDPVAVALPAHWQTFSILLGAWWCGAHVVSTPEGSVAAFVTPGEDANHGSAGARASAVVSLHPMGAGLAEPPLGAYDFLEDSRSYGDEYLALEPVPGSLPALDGLSVDEAASAALDRAGALGLEAGSRALSTLGWNSRAGLVDGMLAVLAAGASLVQVGNPDPAKLRERAETEHCTVRLG
jgi:uncharacterized protein (TIGR03089 family)